MKRVALSFISTIIIIGILTMTCGITPVEWWPVR